MKTFKFKIAPLLLAGFLLPLLWGCDSEKKPSNPEEAKTWEVRIDKVHDVLLGHTTEVKVKMEHLGVIPGGFELNVGYDPAVMLLTQANLGQHLADCGWEYFAYQYTYDPGCGSGCPAGQLRLIGVADIAANGKHPDFDCIEQTPVVDLATLTFLVSSDRQYECTAQPIRFFWNDCGDNSLSNIEGDTLFVSRFVWDFDGGKFYDYAHPLPTYFGAPSDSCLNDTGFNPKRLIDYHNGALEIVCSDSINGIDIGDVSCNGIPFEIADAVAYAYYFVNGPSVFGSHIECSTEASDVNHDGQTLTVADMVYLTRIIVGDAIPNPPPVSGSVQAQLKGGKITLNTPEKLGAALFVFQITGGIGSPILEIPEMDIMYAAGGSELRILVFNIGAEYIPAGENHVLTVGGNLSLISTEVATFEGAMIESTW